MNIIDVFFFVFFDLAALLFCIAVGAKFSFASLYNAFLSSSSTTTISNDAKDTMPLNSLMPSNGFEKIRSIF